MLRRIYDLNFFDAFIAGATAVAVPLMMLESGIGAAAIGIAFSLAAGARIIFRLFGGAAADTLGERKMYFAASLCNLLQTLFYYFTPTAIGFTLGKAMDSARDSVMSSLGRVSVLAATPQKEHFGLAGMMSGRFAYNALGSLAVGVLFASGGFPLVLCALAAIATFMLFLSLGVKNRHPHGNAIRLSDFSFGGRRREFYEAVGVMLLGAALYPVMLYFAVPLYFEANGHSASDIGIYFAAYFLILAATMNALSHRGARTGTVAAAGTAIFVLSLSGMVLFPQFMPLLFLIMAFGDGCLGLLWEEACFVAVKRSRRKAIDLSVALTPASIAISLSFAVSGFAVEEYGFAPIFALAALSLVGFAAWVVRLSKMK